jgi:magnesium transporter
MDEVEYIDKFAQIEEIFNLVDKAQLKEALSEIPIIDVAEFLNQKNPEEIKHILDRVDHENQGQIFSEFDLETQLALFNYYDKLSFAFIFENMYSDVRADLYQELSKEQQISLLPYLEKKIREDVIALSSYPPETAGGIMNTDFATVVIHMSAEQAIAKIRKDAPSQKMIYYIYAVDVNMKMLGIVSLKDLIMSDPKTKVADMIKENFVFSYVDDDKEDAARKIEKYALVAIPVLNREDQLVGIVSYEDAMDVIQDEHTEDLEKFMGIVPSDDGLDYLSTSSVQHFKKRITWIVSLSILSIVSGVIIHRYEGLLSSLIILALYMPMMADTGGNAGSQAATVVIRALSLGEVKISDWLKIIFKEWKISFLMASVVGALTFFKILLLSNKNQVPSHVTLVDIATVIATALTIQVMTATIIGAGLPLIVKKLNGDPAVAASPAITTLVDITGLLIYFTVATIGLGM